MDQKITNQMSKQYFTKYLPVEGEIKKGVKVYHKNSGTYFNFDLPDEQNLESYQKVKLFLCSRDIQVDDKLISYNENLTGIVTSTEYNEDGEKYYVDLSNNTKGLIQTKSTDENHPPNIINWFKIVGEISPGALSFVKEGQEFREDQIMTSLIEDWNYQVHIRDSKGEWK